MFNGEKYTDNEIFQILNLTETPTKEELETQLMHYINKYASIGNDAGNNLARFFLEAYDRFFGINEPNTIEYMQNNDEHDDYDENDDPKYDEDEDEYDDDEEDDEYNKNNMNNKEIETFETMYGNIKSSSVGTVEPNSTGTLKYYDLVNKKDVADLQITKQVEYSNDVLNPILKQTIRRIISVDSQYRENKQSDPTSFTFNLSEPLKNVLALRLYSVQIPYTWYTVNSSYGGNFFYLKGNVAGINNGNHDYKIEIASGNYSPTELVNAINTSITNMKQTYTDVSFGRTALTYNPNNILSTFTIDITKVYDQTNFYVEFPNITSTQTKTGRLSSLASYLGFNYSIYDIFAVYSSRNLLTTIETAIYDNDTSIYSVNDTNNTLTLAIYQGDTYATATNIIENINISISQNRYTRNALIEELQTKLKSSPKLDATFSNIERIDILDSSKQDYGKSFFKLSIKPNRQTATYNLKNIKYAVLFPELDTAIPPIWQGNASCFNFDNSINEINTVKTETETLQSNYPITRINQIQFICVATGYINDINNYIATIPLYRDPGYILIDYINNINTAIISANTAYSISPDNDDLNISTGKTGMYINQNNVYLDIDINRIYTNKYYQLTTNISDDYLPTINFPAYNLNTGNGVFVHRFIIRPYVINIADTIIVEPLAGNSSGNIGASPFVVNLTDVVGGESFNNVEYLRRHILNKLTTYSDVNGSFPLQGSTLTFQYDPTDRQYGIFTLTINVQKSLSQKDYKIIFYDEIAPANDPLNNWNTYLHFGQPEYLLGTDTSFVITNVNGLTTIKNDTPVYDNRIQLYDGLNNYFYIKAKQVDGLTGSNNEIIKITIPVNQDGAEYTLDDLLDNINIQFQQNEILSQSRISVINEGVNIFCKLDIVANVVYTTKDYNLVFYDPYSFVNCYVGATRKGARAIRNTTWDTTLGWILGFRENIVYYLGDYINNTTDNLIYFEPDTTTTTPTKTNVCKLTGDTCVNVNLYSYFLIVLDDYTQSHLNDGLVSIIPQENRVNVPSNANVVCDPISGEKYVSGAKTEIYGKTLTTKQLYSYNQRLNERKTKAKSYSAGPFVKDVMGLIPIKPSTTNGTVYVEFGGTLQNQDRIYFGPVNIDRITVKLVNDKGDVVDLNNTNWSFSLMCEQLYNSKSTNTGNS